MTNASQSAEILTWLRRGKSITPLLALRRFNCFRLAARIRDLREAGHDIKTASFALGNGKRIARYSLSRVGLIATRGMRELRRQGKI